MLKKFVLATCAIVFCILTLALSGCMNEEDYYTKEDVSSLVSQLEETIKEYETKISKLTEKIAETNSENADEIKALKDHYNDEISKLTQKIAELNSENTDEIEGLKDYYDTEISKLTELISELSKEIDELKISCAHSFGEWICYFGSKEISCENRLYYRVCDDCSSMEWLHGSYNNHDWESEYTTDDTHHWIACKNCNEKYSHTPHVDNDENSKCDNCNFEIKTINILVNGENIKGFKIKVDMSNELMLEAAELFQNAVYTSCNCEIDIVDASYEDQGKFVIFEVADDAGEDGFKAYVKDGNLIFATEFPNKAKDATEAFISENFPTEIAKSVNFTNEFTYTSQVRYVYYSEFKRIDAATGKQDDFATIKACHDYANEWGHTVRADADATYYIGDVYGRSIEVKTNVEWGNAIFNIDDNAVDVSSISRTSHIFAIKSSFSDWKTVYYEDSDIVNLVKNGFDGPSLSKIPFAPGYKSLVYFQDDNNYAYNRFGTYATATPPVQREFVIVEADGTITDNTAFLLNFTGVTEIDVYRVDDEPINISGGTFITEANDAPSANTPYKRGILLTRSNTKICNTVHEITRESYSGAPYAGFIQSKYANNILCENLTLQGHKTYQDYNDDGTIRSNMETYDISFDYSNEIVLKNCTQSNFYGSGWTPTNHGGIMSSNYCKNITYDECFLTTINAKSGGVYNVTVKNSTLGKIQLTGGGTAYFENVTCFNNSAFIELRADFGSSWDGEIILKDCTYNYQSGYSDPNVIRASWYNWSFFENYQCTLPDVTIDNLTLTNQADTVNIFNFLCSETYIDQEILGNGEKNQNVMNISASVTVKNNKQGYDFFVSANSYLNSKLTFILCE